MYKKLLLQTAFVTMASDGNIAVEEIEKLKEIFTSKEDFADVILDDEIAKFTAEVKEKGNEFFQNYYKKLKTFDLSEKEQLEIIDVSIQIIKADEVIEYDEVKFFKALRYCLKIDDEIVIKALSETHYDIQLFLGSDIEKKLPEFQSYSGIIQSMEEIKLTMEKKE